RTRPHGFHGRRARGDRQARDRQRHQSLGRIEQRIGSEADAIVRSLAGNLLAAVDAARGRFLLGIAGPPGAGKSTLAGALAAAVGEQRGAGIAVVAPLDGFHLSNETLDRLGLRSVKGAPQTFDAAAFVTALRRVREEPAATVLWPDFDRVVEETVAGAIPIGSD